MAQQRKRTAGDDLRDFKAGKISGNFYHNGIDRSDNYIQHTSAPRYITDENGKTTGGVHITNGFSRKYFSINTIYQTTQVRHHQIIKQRQMIFL